ncbi:hypothetical protein C2E25_07800 [Geothermobacter hydrogeniphilus]|uniref:CobQ/CobB/MinD/ParA nucleotide binding domain-containing protein n=1 Tax=Geothermobacter hydrogeniphilus TaxID=1969733 RepID=A0A2K2HAH5_9BACT|nr:ParA family protein [Geothermobacter hydrogeniphilus]PNU20318.1 hypothetical protein C2E25_07800 [Geothermobacter hydrogeniphilus]
MGPDQLFVVVVASEKGGVGKTTIATNLAVYLKALAEDLPVTIASFDNHFSVDNMFAIGRQRAVSVVDLFAGRQPFGPAMLGEYGVQYLASQRQLEPPPAADSATLRKRLAGSGLRGILILDTRPILDFFTRSALEAADLVLVPVKDRASLVNVASIHNLMNDRPEEERLWLVPSLIDGRLKLKGRVGMRDYLVFNGEERGYRFAPTHISKSPKVEGLASGFSSRIHPVLIHARGTAVHRQLRILADFVLERRASCPRGRCRQGALALEGAVPEGRLRRLLPDCPVCGTAGDGGSGRLFFDRRSRRRGFLHEDCFQRLLEGTDLRTLLTGQRGLLALTLTGGGLSGEGRRLCLALFDADGTCQLEEIPTARTGRRLEAFLVTAAGRDDPSELFQELLLIPLTGDPPVTLLQDPGYRNWRRLALRAARDRSLRER